MKIDIKKILLMVVSLFLSFVLWLYVMSVTDIDGRVQVKEIKVEITGQESLASRNLSVISCTPEISLYFKGRRTDLTKLDKNSVSVVLDVSDIMIAGTYTRSYTDIVWPEGITSSMVSPEWTPPQIELLVDKMSFTVVPVKVNSNVVPMEGYIVDRLQVEPTEIRIDGPETVLETISHVEVRLDENELDRTVERTKGYILIDHDGNEVDEANLERSPAEVRVTVPVRKTKTIMLDVDFLDGGGITKDENVTYEITPPSIIISGDAAVLDAINVLKLGQIDLSKVDSDQTIDMPIFLPNECNNLSGVTNASVSITISGVQTRPIGASNIECINGDIPEGYQINLITTEVTVHVRGPANLVEQVNPYNILIVVDLEGQTLQLGQRTFNATVHINGINRVGAVGDYTVSLEIVPIVNDEVLEE